MTDYKGVDMSESSEADEARAEAKRQHEPILCQDFQVGFVAGAGWQASRKAEAAPSDPHIGVEHEGYCHLQRGMGGRCNCTPQPVRVEVTDELTHRVYRAYRAAQRGGRLSDAIYEATFSKVEFEWFQAALADALGGGDRG